MGFKLQCREYRDRCDICGLLKEEKPYIKLCRHVTSDFTKILLRAFIKRNLEVRILRNKIRGRQQPANRFNSFINHLHVVRTYLLAQNIYYVRKFLPVFNSQAIEEKCQKRMSKYITDSLIEYDWICNNGQTWKHQW